MKSLNIILLAVSLLFTSLDICNAGSVSIWNNAWKNGVKVEIRVGRNEYAELNLLWGITVINYGQNITVTTNGDDDVWWRRERDPEFPTGQFGDWNRKSVFWNADYDVNVD